MSGRTEPTTEELSNNLRKRLLTIEDSEMLSKRYNRLGVPKPQANGKKAGSSAALATLPAEGKKGKSNGNGKTSVSSDPGSA